MILDRHNTSLFMTATMWSLICGDLDDAFPLPESILLPPNSFPPFLLPLCIAEPSPSKLFLNQEVWQGLPPHIVEPVLIAFSAVLAVNPLLVQLVNSLTPILHNQQSHWSLPLAWPTYWLPLLNSPLLRISNCQWSIIQPFRVVAISWLTLYIIQDLKSCTMLDEMVETYHSSKLSKLDTLSADNISFLCSISFLFQALIHHWYRASEHWHDTKTLLF